MNECQHSNDMCTWVDCASSTFTLTVILSTHLHEIQSLVILPAISLIILKSAISNVISTDFVIKINDTHSIVPALLFLLYRIPRHHAVEDPDIWMAPIGPALQRIEEVLDVPLRETRIAVAHGQVFDVVHIKLDEPGSSQLCGEPLFERGPIGQCIQTVPPSISLCDFFVFCVQCTCCSMVNPMAITDVVG